MRWFFLLLFSEIDVVSVFKKLLARGWIRQSEEFPRRLVASVSPWANRQVPLQCGMALQRQATNEI